MCTAAIGGVKGMAATMATFLVLCNYVMDFATQESSCHIITQSLNLSILTVLSVAINRNSLSTNRGRN